MKLIFTLLLLLAPFQTYGQNSFRMDMVVQKVSKDKFICDNNVRVYWGYHHDTLWFKFEEEELILMPYKSSKNTPDKVKNFEKVEREKNINSYYNNERFFIRKNEYDEYYIIHTIIGKSGIMMFVSNISNNHPHYNFCFGVDCYCK